MSVGRERRDLTGTRRFLCRLQQLRQLGDIRRSPSQRARRKALLAGVYNEITRASQLGSLPPLDIASAPLTYVAAHTVRLATKVE